MTTIKITPVGSVKAESVDKKDFLGALEGCNPVNNIITIKGRQYQLNSVEFGCGCDASDCLVYEALLTQSDAGVPQAIVLNDKEANFLQVDNWNYHGTGVISAVTSQNFLEQSRVAFTSQVQGTHISTRSKGTKSVLFEIQDLKDFSNVDGRLNLTYVCIKVKCNYTPEMKKMLAEIVAKESVADTADARSTS